MRVVRCAGGVQVREVLGREGEEDVEEVGVLEGGFEAEGEAGC